MGLAVNRTYRSIWNAAIGTRVTAAETVKARREKSHRETVPRGEGRVGPKIPCQVNERTMTILSLRLPACLNMSAYSQQFIVNDNGDTGCHEVADGVTVGETILDFACNTISTARVMLVSGGLAVGGANGTGTIGGLPTSTGGTTTAGGSTANAHGFHVVSNGPYLNGGTNGTHIIGIIRVPGLASLNGGVGLNNRKITSLAPGTASATWTNAVNSSQLASLSTRRPTGLSSADSSVASLPHRPGIGSLSIGLGTTDTHVASLAGSFIFC